MACNCKKKAEIEEKYGVEEEETLLGKIYRQIWKLIIVVIVVLLAVVISPIMMILVVYNIFFGKGKPITLPKKLRKYLK